MQSNNNNFHDYFCKRFANAVHTDRNRLFVCGFVKIH